MKLESFKAGRWMPRYQYKSFEPVPVNHDWTWEDARVHVLLEQANRALGELNAFSLIVPDIDLFIDDAQFGIANLPSESVAQNDQLDQRENHGHHHQCGGTNELAHFALDDRHHPVHGCIPGRCGMVKAWALTSSSRNWRPV